MILPFAGGVSPPLGWFLFCFQRVIHRIVAPTTCSLTTCSLTTCFRVSRKREELPGGVSRKRVENCPESQRSVDNPKNGPQKRSKPLCGLAGRKKRCHGPRSSLLDALTGLLAELEAFLARRIGVVQLLERDEEPAQRPPEAPDGIFRVWVVLSDVGFRLCHGTSSRLHRKHPARVRSLLGDPGATPRDAVGRSWVQSRASRATGSIRPWRSCSSGPAKPS